MFSKSRVLFAFLLFFCTSVLSVGAVILRREKRGDLNVYLGSEDCHSPTIDELIKRANGAFDSLSSLGLSKTQKPKAITLLWAGDNKCMYASSAKGSGHVMANPDIPSHVQAALNPESAHQNHARCGEIMVISEWFRENVGKQHLPSTKLIVTVKEDGVETPCVVNPRGQDRGATFGCRQFLTRMGFTDSQMIDHEIMPKISSMLRRSLCKLSKGTRAAGVTPGHRNAHISRTKKRKSGLKRQAASRGAKYRRDVLFTGWKEQ